MASIAALGPSCTGSHHFCSGGRAPNSRAAAGFRHTLSESRSRSCHINGSVDTAQQRARFTCCAKSHQVEMLHEGKSHMLTIQDGDTVLSAALDAGIQLPHDCQLGVCMTCPAKLLKGNVDQFGCILNEDVLAAGYVLTCVAVPTMDCTITTISEDELLDLQLNSQ